MRSTTESICIAIIACFIFAPAPRAEEQGSSGRYSSIPNLAEEQKAKIEAIQKQTDEQVMAILNDEQKAALRTTIEKPAEPGSGLYSAETNGKKDGPIKSRDYWQSKFNAEQLEQAIKEHQPEGAIALALISDVQLLDGLLKDYPAHRELHAWHDRAVAVQKQIGENFDRSASFKPGCLWNEDSYMQAYVGYNTAATALADNDQELAFSMSGLALQKVNFLTEDNGERMSAYPPEAREWIKKIKPELEKIHESSGKATHHI